MQKKHVIMKKLVLIGAILAVSVMSYSQKKEKTETKEEIPILCKVYRELIGDLSHGCGGGQNICCVNSKLKHR